jgi:branched-chain amino acid transport system substrate-binding protein
VIFSVSGSYCTVGQEMLNGALLALEEVNTSASFDFTFDPVIANPGGDAAAYRSQCEDILRDRSVRHVVGCYTSSSRKEVIPAIEKFDALLWYPSHYEGFESSNNVIYTGASPNQHIIPLLEYMIRQGGRRVYCVGSNYIWAWENNRILRAVVQACGGTVLAEKYLPVGSLDIERIIREIRLLQPDFVFNTLIGESSYAFYRTYATVDFGHGRLGSAGIPMTSCSLSEPELLSIGGQAATGHIASSVYFQSIDQPRNRAFVESYRRRFGAAKVTSADAEASYIAVILLAEAIRAAGSTQIEEIKKALYRCRLTAPQGPVWIDPENNHSYLTPALGLSRGDGEFDIVWTAGEPVKPDPYLAWLDVASLAEQAAREQRGHLRVIPR